MEEISRETQANIDGIMRYLTEYIDIRFAHAGRLNSRLLAVEDDLKWHELGSIAHLLASTKPFGEKRFSIADMITSFDKNNKELLFNPKRQASIMAEVVTVVEEADQSTGLLEIRDLRGLYQAIDPALERVIKLIQTWLWWDLPDAGDVWLFDCQESLVYETLDSEPDAAKLAAYRALLERDPRLPIEKKDAVDFEFYRAEEIVKGLRHRREFSGDYQCVIGRERVGGGGDRETILLLAQHFRAMEELEGEGEMSARLREYFAGVLGCAPDAVTREKALAYEKNYIAETEVRLIADLRTAGSGGRPYDFKARQMEKIEARFASLAKAVNPRPREALYPKPPPKEEEEKKEEETSLF